ncbi:hypothetical protein HanXRQr2_Chr04g0139731 [Helianthus annuus]|uniref:Uncharacterized protein n=1 Tax=Helianthus annuus TaxID=4232 RepID=A0A9K3J339_HELAN|nr:hypothetical protein HanXRQr2_Chr04g0139731 [Helianthus annuus]
MKVLDNGGLTSKLSILCGSTVHPEYKSRPGKCSTLFIGYVVSRRRCHHVLYPRYYGKRLVHGATFPNYLVSMLGIYIYYKFTAL